ncbi:MAG TPA: hypothetical protein VFO16_02610, partial [Pseudonocardiaceae bacterium]|nr:hypothetical protein [Pseudonocardiaceae bacterium]
MSAPRETGTRDSCPCCGAASGFPAGHRPNNEVPGAPPVPHPPQNTSTGTVQPPADRWLDAEGIPIPVGAVVEQTTVDIELGALRSRLGERGLVLRRSATRLVVGFDGETALARIRPQLLRVLGDDPAEPRVPLTLRLCDSLARWSLTTWMGETPAQPSQGRGEAGCRRRSRRPSGRRTGRTRRRIGSARRGRSGLSR